METSRGKCWTANRESPTPHFYLHLYTHRAHTYTHTHTYTTNTALSFWLIVFVTLLAARVPKEFCDTIPRDAFAAVRYDNDATAPTMDT